MKLNKIILSSALVLSSLFAAAQTKDSIEYVFNPHWYLQAQIGGQETLGETSFGTLLSPNAQLVAGYNFHEVVGARLALNSWQSKGAWEYDGDKNDYAWKYIAAHVDLTFDLTTLIDGYKPNRLVTAGIYGGIGANFAWDNREAKEVKAKLTEAGVENALEYYWTGDDDGTKISFVGSFGAYADFRVSSRVSVGLELQANVLTDHYNSKRADNADWYFNALVGVKIALGKTHTTRVVKVDPIPEYKPCCDTVIIERVVERVVEKEPAPAPVEVKKEPFRRDIFFTINNTTISSKEQSKVDEVVEYLKKNPDAKVIVTGYADKGTGTVKINLRLSNQRASTVAKALISSGISTDRIITRAMDESYEQPYPDPIQNRVAICIAE